MHVCTFRFYN